MIHTQDINLRKKLLQLGIFSIAMAFLEAAVVYYIRMLYYPEGFSFPLKILELNVAKVEIAREFATLIMLLSIAWIAGRSFAERFAWFIFCFGIWDIFYYVFLYITLSWPPDPLTWDVLFLIPLTWVGPVLAPVINSLMMIALAVIILWKSYSDDQYAIGAVNMILLIAGSVVIIFGYVEDYTSYMLGYFNLGELLLPRGKSGEIISRALLYVPVSFNWWIFLGGCLLHLIAIIRIIVNKSGPVSLLKVR